MKYFLISSTVFICSLTQSTFASVRFDDSYLVKNTNLVAENEQFDALASQLSTNASEQLSLLKESGGLQGLFVRLEESQSLDSDYFDRKVALELEVFKSGILGQGKAQSLDMVNKELELLRLKHAIQSRHADNTRYRLNQVKNLINQKTWKEISDHYKKLVKIRAEQLQEGLIEQTDLISVQAKSIRADATINYYSNTPIQHLNNDWFNLLNQIDRVALIEDQALLNKAINNSIEIAIQDLYIKKTNFAPEYIDDVSLRVFLERRENNRFLSDSENMVGVRARLPIEFNSNQDKINTASKHSFKLQKRAIEIRLQEKISTFRQMFEFSQSTIRSLEVEYKSLIKAYEVAKKQEQAVLLGLKYTPERKQDELKTKQLMLYQKILFTRLEAFEALSQLLNTVAVENMSELLSN